MNTNIINRRTIYTPALAVPGAGGGGGGPVVFAITSRAVIQRGVFGTSATFVLDTGTGTVLIIVSGSLAGLSTATLDTGAGPVTMNKAIENGAGNNSNSYRSVIFYLNGLTAHASSSFVISNAFVKDIQVASAVLTGNSATPGTGAVADEAFGTSFAMGPVTIPSNGVGIVGFCNNDGTASSDVGGNLGTIDYNTDASNCVFVAHDLTSGAQTATVGTSGASTYSGVFLPWGP